MAWIVKESAKTKIERRKEPYVTAEIREHFTQVMLPRYATKRAALLPLCHAVQHETGWLPAQALEEIAEFLELAPAEVWDTVSFYEEFNLKPLGEHVIQICRSIACEVCGCNEISKKVQAKLGILPGETTDDGRFTLQELECLGACDFAPVALVDEKLQKTLSFEDLEAEIDRLGG